LLFDSHAHYDDARFDGDRDEILRQMKDNGVGCIINVGADLASSKKSVEIASKYDFIYSSVGVHPHDAGKMCENDISELESLLSNEKVVALGEIGLDYYYENFDRESQKKWFERQLELAVSKAMPVIIHDRDAHGDCLAIVRKFKNIKGVFHCYSGSVEMAQELLNMGLYISFTGVVTYKNAGKVCEVVKYVPDDRILIETDCPYLSPVPHRGERNSSLYLKYTAQKIAEIKGLTFDEIAKLTYENTMKCFDIGG